MSVRGAAPRLIWARPKPGIIRLPVIARDCGTCFQPGRTLRYSVRHSIKSLVAGRPADGYQQCRAMYCPAMPNAGRHLTTVADLNL